MDRILKVNRAFKKVEELILSVCIILMAIILVANVIGRTFLNHSLTFAEEFCALLTVMVTFAGTSYCARLSCHICMTAVFDLLPMAGKKVFMFIVSVVTAGSVLYIAYQAILYIMNLQSSGRFTPSLHIPLWIPYLIIPLGLVFTAIQYLVTLGLNFRDRDEIHTGVEKIIDESVNVSDEAIRQMQEGGDAE